jgi:hypothetical protein
LSLVGAARAAFWDRELRTASTIADMSFAVSVNTDARGDQESLYWSAIAGDGDMHEFWSGRAVRLGLPLLANAYNAGLKLCGDELVALRHEVEALWANWVESVSADETRTTTIGNRTFDVPLLVHLMDRAESVESAIRLAIAVDGYLTIS